MGPIVKNAFLIVLPLLVLSSCETLEEINPSFHEFTKNESYIGCCLIETPEGVKILSVSQGLPASEAGFMAGDIIKSINGSSIVDGIQCNSVIGILSLDSAAEFVVVRNGVSKSIFCTPRRREIPIEFNNSPTRKIGDMLTKSKEVSVLIIIGEVSNAAAGYVKNEEWEKGIRRAAQSHYEKEFLTDFSVYPNFHIIDRYRTDEVLKKLKFSLGGTISEDFRIQIGKLTGASHIQHLTICRYQQRYGFRDETDERLISVKTGEVVGSFSYTHNVSR